MARCEALYLYSTIFRVEPDPNQTGQEESTPVSAASVNRVRIDHY